MTTCQYNARAAVPDSADWIAHYAVLAERVETWPGFMEPPAYGVVYGEGPDDRLDIFPAPRPGSPVFVFIHGGYWRALSRRDGIFMAPLFHRAGATVVSVDYSLAPAVTLPQIAGQVARALQWIAANIGQYNGDAARLHVSGHSAGAQLAAMMLVDLRAWPMAKVEGDIPPVHSVSLFSGLFDLRPLLQTEINGWLGMDDAVARAMSPALHAPRRGCPAVVVCGEAETDAFRWQSRMFVETWGALPGVPRPVHLEPAGRHHFDCPLSLAVPDAASTRIILEILGLDATRVDADGLPLPGRPSARAVAGGAVSGPGPAAMPGPDGGGRDDPAA
jgi:arylformamidase